MALHVPLRKLMLGCSPVLQGQEKCRSLCIVLRTWLSVLIHSLCRILLRKGADKQPASGLHGRHGERTLHRGVLGSPEKQANRRGLLQGSWFM